MTPFPPKTGAMPVNIQLPSQSCCQRCREICHHEAARSTLVTGIS